LPQYLTLKTITVRPSSHCAKNEILKRNVNHGGKKEFLIVSVIPQEIPEEGENSRLLVGHK
jgi:hypothetical protein